MSRREDDRPRTHQVRGKGSTHPPTPLRVQNSRLLVSTPPDAKVPMFGTLDDPLPRYHMCLCLGVPGRSFYRCLNDSVTGVYKYQRPFPSGRIVSDYYDVVAQLTFLPRKFVGKSVGSGEELISHPGSVTFGPTHLRRTHESSHTRTSIHLGSRPCKPFGLALVGRGLTIFREKLVDSYRS